MKLLDKKEDFKTVAQLLTDCIDICEKVNIELKEELKLLENE
jgi:hypothetical protein